MQRVAILGLGIMGGGMAANWLAKGFEVSVWNRTRAKAEPLAAKGAKIAATPREAATGADFIFAMVADDDASRTVWLGADGALAGAKSGAIGVESSTLDPRLDPRARPSGSSQGRRLSRCAGRRQPSGGGRLANSGSLSAATRKPTRPRVPRLRRSAARWICSGRSARARPGSSSTTSSPPVRSPRSPKRSRSPRRPASKTSKSPSSSSAAPPASPIVKLKLPRMLAQDFEPADFALNLMLKDARYAAALAQSLGAPAGMIEGAAKAFARADAKGLGDKDIAAVVG